MESKAPKMKRKIEKMSRVQLIGLINHLLNEREHRSNHINKISVCDVEVESNCESLERCKSIVNELIKQNGQFITLRKNKLKAETLGYFG